MATQRQKMRGASAKETQGISEHETTAPTVRVKVWAQDPLVEPGLVELTIPASDLESGPKDSQFVVLDQDISSGVIYEQARYFPDKQAFDELEPEDIRFHQVNAFAIARTSLNMIEAAIGRQVHWAFGPQLMIHPHYMQSRNAFYSRDLGALAFFYFDIPFKVGKVFTCLSHDIVSHELGHAALDGLKPLFLEALHRETGAFHESFGDFTAMFSALELPEVVENVLTATDGDLRKPSLASLLAEEFGYGIYGPGHFFLRNANDPVTYKTLRSYEVHDFSVLLTATLFEILTEFFEINRGAVYTVQGVGSEGLFLRQGPSTTSLTLGTLQEGTEVIQVGDSYNDGKRTWRYIRTPQLGVGWAAGDYLVEGSEQVTDTEALIEATRHLRRIVYRAVNYLPPSSVTFKRFGQAMIAADTRAFPNDERGYRDIIKRVFTARQIADMPQELETSLPIRLEWDGKTDKRSVYQFIYRNRYMLGIPSDPAYKLNYPTISSIDLSGVTSTGAVPLQETIIEYSYTQEVQVMGFCTYFVNFGGTLVFDENRQLVAHFTDAETPGNNNAMIDQGLEFYRELKDRKQIKALTWRRPDARPTDAAYLLYRLPDGRGQLRLNVCSRFSAKSLDLPGRRVVQVDLPDPEHNGEDLPNM